MSVTAEALSPEAIRLPPTLVVGVGGIGCWIADRVYSKAQEAGLTSGNRIVILGFDTDENALGNLRHLQAGQLVRTSTADTVFNILRRRRRDLEDWFVPDDQLTTEIRQMTLLDGAGAIRMLSRLAFDEALRDDEIGPRLRSVVGSIATQNNRDIFEGRVNVLMVGSIAGGTGSGMFLQAALMLGDILRDLGITPEVRGLFLLPDVVVNGARIAKKQIPGVRANAYAALKELNAVTRHTTALGATGGRARPVSFEYAPGQKLKDDGRPFTSVVLLDYEQTRGSNLGHNFDAYRELAANAAYTLLFTPIGGSYASQAVNDIRAKHAAAAANEDNRFAGIGVSAVVYPRDAILDYLCIRYGLHVLSGDWLRIDTEFRDELRRFQARVEHGESSLEKPRIGAFYPQKLEQLANSEKIAFFKRLHDGVHVRHENDHGRHTTEERFVTYLDALESHLIDAFWSQDQPLRIARTREELGRDVLNAKVSLTGAVSEFEGHLRKDFEAVERGLASTVETLFATSVLGAALLSETEWQDRHLEAHLVRGGPHLVQARYFLYKLRALIAERAKGLDAKRKRDAIAEKMRVTFDDPDTEAVETAGDRAERAARLPLPDSIDPLLSKFAKSYRDHYNEVTWMIRMLGDEGVRERLYALLDGYVKRLLDVIERFFNDLSDLADDLGLERNRQEGAHDAAAGLGHAARYVFADAEAKQSLWAELRERLQGSSAEDDKVNAALSRALMERFREEGRPNRWEDPGPFSGAELFRRHVVDGSARTLIGNEHGSVYRLDAIQAIRREARLTGRDPEQHLSELLNLISAHSEPFLSISDNDAGQSYRFWALSPGNAQQLGSADRVEALFRRNHGESPLIEPEFPDHTLLCLATRVDLRLADLSKLDPGLEGHNNISARQPGVYYRAYREMVDRALAHERADPGSPNPVFTPHLDRAWHRPGVLPEIHAELEAQQDQGLMDAYVCALALDLLPWAERDGVPVTLFRDHAREGTLDFEQIIAKVQDDLAVLELLGREPGMVTSVLERRDRLTAAPATGGQDLLHQGLSRGEVLARIGRLLSDRTRLELAGPRIEGAVAALIRNLALASDRVHRRLGDNGRRAELEKTVGALIDAAAVDLASTLDAEAIEQLRALAAGQLARWLASGAAG